MPLIRIVLILVVIAAVGYGETDHNANMEVTYIANCGFLIECDGKKVLIDGLFGNLESNWCFVPSDSIVALMQQAKPPFDDIDIIAVTHAHVDHFNADIVSNHLAHNRRGVFICPGQADEKLSALDNYSDIKGRVRVLSLPIDSMVTIEIAGVTIKAIETKHSPYFENDTSTGESVDRHQNVEHLEYLFKVASQTIYHSGDGIMNDIVKYQSYGFGEKPISLAFVSWWDARDRLSFRQKLIHDVILPERIILMHLAPYRKPRGNPERQRTVASEVFVPDYSMEQWMLPIEIDSTKY